MQGWNDPIDPSEPDRIGRPAADHPAPEPWYDAVHHSYDPAGRYPYQNSGRHRHDEAVGPDTPRWPDGYDAPDERYGADAAATGTFRPVSGYGPDGGGLRDGYPTGGHAAAPPSRDGYAGGNGYARYGGGQDTGWPDDGVERPAEGAGPAGYPEEPYQRRVDDRDPDGFWSDQHDRYRSAGTPDGVVADPGGRRLPRPVVLAGAAAAATLAVMAGVGAVVLPGDPPERSRTVATADGGATPTDTTDLAGGATPTPGGATPSSAAPSPSAAPRPTATPAPRRSTAPPVRRTASAPASRSGGSTGGPSANGAVTSQEQQVIDLVDKERAAAGCGPLAADSHLMTSARLHSADQAEHTEMSHTGSDGSSFDQRIKRAGYDGRTMAENVAYGYPTPAAVMDGWMNSSGHRANILNCAYKHIGVGVAKGGDGRLYWTQNFGG